LVVAFAAWPHHLSSDLDVRPGEQAFGNYIKIAKDGRITVAVPQVETGQGVWTALPQIVADELGAAWETVAVEPAPLASAYANPLAVNEGWLDGFGALRRHLIASDSRSRITADSTSVRAFEQPLREAAAVARSMLVGAAADRWNIDPTKCDTGDGFVINGVRTFTFGELAEEAADRSPPAKAQLRQSARGRLIGQPLQRLDGPAKADGSWRFAGDVRLPGMLFASVRLAPSGGKLKSFSRDAIKAPGVRHVVSRETWIAVAADSWWAAERALKEADPIFSGPRTPADVRPLFERALAHGNPERFRRGDYEGAVRGSHPLAASYYVAPSQHLELEPLTATARFDGRHLELWAPTQAPGLAREAGGRATRTGNSDIFLYPMPVGGPAGRAIEADAIPFAVELARELHMPVQVTLSQSVSQNQDLVSSGALARMTALPSESGITAAWKMQVATINGMGSSIARMLDSDHDERAIRNAIIAIPPYGIPNVTTEVVRADLPFTVGYMRGSPQREFAFFTERFIDELAHAAGMEPLAFRMSMLGNNGRLARCLQAAARLAQWDGGAAGSTMGIAGASAFGSHIGLVATASIGDDQRVKVHRLVAAVDCGRVVNSGLTEQQIAAGLIWALGQATVPAPECVAGMPRARPLGSLGLPRLGDTPDITVSILPSNDEPGGISGLGTLPLAPAVASAIYAGSGKRMRSLPFDVTAA
ncbi:MAG: molybdopterin cofactor-binding domain-containing protein, partial [Sphingomicrobium sp.]